MTTAIDYPQLATTMWIESHQCRVEAYEKLISQAIRSHEPLHEICLLLFIKDTLQARKCTGIRTPITLEDFLAHMKAEGLSREWSEYAWHHFKWPHIITPPL